MANELISKSNDLSLLSNPETGLELINQTALFFKKRKIGLPEIGARMMGRGLDLYSEYQITDSLNVLIAKLPKEEALGCFNSLDYKLRAVIIQHNEQLNVELIRRLDIPIRQVGKAFMATRTIFPPKDSPYASQYADFDENYAEELVNLLRPLKPAEITEALEAIGIKSLYMIAVTEIAELADGNQENCHDLFCAFDADDIVPPEFPFLAFVQEKSPSIYKVLAGELNNPLWPEARHMFYELFERNKTLLRDKLYEGGCDEGGFLSDLFSE